MSKVSEYFQNHQVSAPLAVGFLGLAVLAAVVLPVMTYVGKYSATMQKFMKTAVKIGGHDAGQNWMWVAGGAAGATAVGLTSLAVSLRNKKEVKPVATPTGTTEQPVVTAQQQPTTAAPKQPEMKTPVNPDQNEGTTTTGTTEQPIVTAQLEPTTITPKQTETKKTPVNPDQPAEFQGEYLGVTMDNGYQVWGREDASWFYKDPTTGAFCDHLPAE